jgi:hypothetical protein
MILFFFISPMGINMAALPLTGDQPIREFIFLSASQKLALRKINSKFTTSLVRITLFSKCQSKTGT